MVTINSVFLGGNLGADPEPRRTATGKQMCTFRLAVNRWDAKAQARVADWHKVVAWDKTAEQCLKYLSKGSSVVVEGRLAVSHWEGADGTKRSRHEVMAHRVNFVGRRGESGAQEGPPELTGREGPPTELREIRLAPDELRKFDDAIPF